MTTPSPRVDAAAASVGARDLFVLRRVSDERFVHFGGSGRGAGWAGLVEVEAGESAALSTSLATQAPLRVGHERRELVFGPYYASAAAFVPVANDVAALGGVLEDGRFLYCVQDASVVPLPPPLGEDAGIRSYYLLELHGLARGVLFVAHTDAAPRGFTLLCRRLGLRLADVVSAQPGVALTREWARAEEARLQAAFDRLGET